MRTLEVRQGIRIGCPEEIAHSLGWISSLDLQRRATALIKSDYGQHLVRVNACASPESTLHELVHQPHTTNSLSRLEAANRPRSNRSASLALARFAQPGD